MAAAADVEVNAAGKLKVAQARLDEVRAKGKASASQLLKAENDLSDAERKHVAAQGAAVRSAEQYAAATRKAADEAKNLASKGSLFGKLRSQGADEGTKAGKALGGGMLGAAAKFAGPLAVAFGAAQIVQGFAQVIQKAGDAEQSVGGVAAVFKSQSEQIQRSSREAARAVGLDSNAYRELATTIGSTLKNKGIKDYADQTQNLIKLGADLASQFGGSTQDAVDSLSSALRGEFDPIEKYGVSLSAAAIQAEAFAQGIAKPTKNLDDIRVKQIRATLAQKAYNEAVREHGKSSDEALTAEARLGSAQGILEKALKGSTPQLTNQQKAMAALSLVTKQTKDAQGNFARENDTFAHKQQVAAAEWENVTTAIGTKFLPLATKAMGYIADSGIPTFEAFGKIISATVGPIGSASGSFSKFVDYLSSHQADVVKAFKSFGDQAIDFGESFVSVSADALQGFGVFVASGISGFNRFVQVTGAGLLSLAEGFNRTLAVAKLLNPALAFVPKIDIEGMKDGLADLDASSRRSADNVTASTKAGADSIRNNVLPAIDRMRDRFDKASKQEIISAKQRDAMAAAAAAVEKIGTKADGSQIHLKKFSDVSKLSDSAQRGLRDRIAKASDALADQLKASRKAGDGQKDLTKTWKDGKAKLYDEFIQMGLSRKEAQKLADKYAGIKPKVETKFTQPGMKGSGGALSQADALKKKYGQIPDYVTTKINFDTQVDKINTKLVYQGGKGARLIGMATGGVLPGWSPGKDIHQFWSPTAGGLNLSGGEAIMRPEWTRAVGGPTEVARMNKAAQSGQKFAAGGVFGKVMTDGTKSVQQTGLAEVSAELKKVVRAMGDVGGGYAGSAGGFGDGGSIAGFAKVAGWVRAHLGIPYLFGGNGPRYDCSSFTQHAMAAAGIRIPRIADAQYDASRHIGKGSLVAGDLGFIQNGGYAHHVGLYMGGGKWAAEHHTGTSSSINGGDGWNAYGRVGRATSKAANEVGGSGGGGGGGNPHGSNRDRGRSLLSSRGFGPSQWPPLNKLWTRESGWNEHALNRSSGAYGIPQSLPGSKMASAGADWRNSPNTQIKWGLGYIKSRYGSPAGAWAHSQRTGWYDDGGLARGIGDLQKRTIKPERVLAPKMTVDFERLVTWLEQNGAPRARSGPLVHVERVDSGVDLELYARQAEFRERAGTFS